MKVLIVEDEEQVALMLERKLKQQGMVVDTAYDGQKAAFDPDVENIENGLRSTIAV